MAEGDAKPGQAADVESQLGVDQIKDKDTKEKAEAYLQTLKPEQKERIRGKAGAELSKLQQQIVLINQGKSTLDDLKKEIDLASGAGSAAAPAPAAPEAPKPPAASETPAPAAPAAPTAPSTAPPPTPDSPPAAPAASAEPEEKEGVLDAAVQGDSKLGDMVKKFISKIPLIGGLIAGAFFSKKTLEKLGIKPSSGSFLSNLLGAKTPEDAKEKEKKAKEILKSEFEIEKVEELELLSTSALKDFLKPDFLDKHKGKIDPKHYAKFVEALNRNGAKDITDDNVKVFEFVITKSGEWKKG